MDADLSGAAPPPDAAAKITELLSEISALAAEYAVPERDRFDGMRPDLPGRGNPLLPPYIVDSVEEGVTRGRVTFSRYHVGGNGAVHGGTHPLLFDDVLGHLTNAQFPTVARTAYLKVNYRAVTPIDVELRYEATLDRAEGRKRFASGRLFGPDGTLLADADALFIELLPGQP